MSEATASPGAQTLWSSIVRLQNMRFDGSQGWWERRHGDVVVLGAFARAGLPHLTRVMRIAWCGSTSRFGIRHTPTRRERVGV